jgi:AraC-like DNA-binding protein
MDPLSDVLALLRPRSYMFRGFDAGGTWSIAFPRSRGIKCFAIVSGECWLSVDGVDGEISLSAGDCFLLPRGLPFRLANDLALAPVSAASLFSEAERGGVVILAGGGDCCGVGGHIALTGDHSDILLGVLPPVVHIRRDADKVALRWSVERMMEELRDPQPGGVVMAQHLASMLLVQALRLHLARTGSGSVGWLSALGDRQVSVAIKAIHEAPDQAWTLPILAGKAGMSRSIFALRFKKTVGVTPIEYLTRWRMLLAADKLAHSSQTVSAVGASLGYASESAFCNAFKRLMGCTPRRYGRRRRVTPEWDDTDLGDLALVHG